MSNYVFKSSVVKGEVYLQIWKRKPRVYVASLGNAAKCVNLLVKLKKQEELTNILQEKVTNLLEENKQLLTKLEDQQKK